MQFPFKNGNENFEIFQDTVCDEKNAYIHIQSKSFRTFSDYTTFTYFKGTTGIKTFACEAGFSTTASDEYRTVFYSNNNNNNWKDITSKVFPYRFTFKDFWIRGKIPPKKFQKFKTYIEIPPKGTYLIAHIVGICEVDKDKLHLNEKDLEIYDKFFDSNNNYFKNIIYLWNAKKEIFVKK